MARKSTSIHRVLFQRILLCGHGIIFVSALCFFILAFYTNRVERSDLGSFMRTNPISYDNVAAYYAASGLLLLSLVFGLLGQFKGNKPSYWITFCFILAVTSLIILAVGGSAIGKADSSVKALKFHIRTTILETYRRDPEWNRRVRWWIMGKWTKEQLDAHTDILLNDDHREWDRIQSVNKCCGLDSYKDWQKVQFGRTSLTIPRSCCVNSSDFFCGINMLPSNKAAEGVKIFAEGCMEKLAKRVRFWLRVMGMFGIVAAVIQLGIVMFVNYLIITKQL